MDSALYFTGKTIPYGLYSFDTFEQIVRMNNMNIFRDINLTSTDGPLASKLAPNGDFYTALLFLDFNAMYLWSQEQEMPLGPGIQWTPSGKSFRKIVLQGQSSFSSLQWLQYEQTKIQVQIQHSFHQGERFIHGFKVDGYAVVDGVETVWEYNGCSYHGCTCIKYPTEQDLKNREKWIERKAKLEVNGCKVIAISHCEWTKKLKYIKKNPPNTELGRILCYDDQEIFTFDTHEQFYSNE